MNTSELNRFIVVLIYGSLVLLSLLKLSNPLRVNRKANFLVWDIPIFVVKLLAG